MAAGLLARNAQKGPQAKPWVKTSLAPGSQVVTDYLAKADAPNISTELGFNLVGYGCTTCIGNSGPAARAVADAIRGDLRSRARCRPATATSKAASIRIARQTIWLAAAGRRLCARRLDGDQPETDPIGTTTRGQAGVPEGHLAEHQEVAATVRKSSPAMFNPLCRRLPGDAGWRKVKTVTGGHDLCWDEVDLRRRTRPISLRAWGSQQRRSARHRRRARWPLRRSDHHRPHLAGRLDQEGRPAGQYLPERGVRGFQLLRRAARQPRVMMRGTFANIRIKNEMLRQRRRRHHRHHPGGSEMSIYDAAMKYQGGVPLVIFAGKGIRHRLRRDWGQRHAAARRQGGDRRELRAHPPFRTWSAWASCRPVRTGHGTASSSASGRRDDPIAGVKPLKQGSRDDDRFHRLCRRHEARPAGQVPASIRSRKSTTTRTAASCLRPAPPSRLFHESGLRRNEKGGSGGRLFHARPTPAPLHEIDGGRSVRVEVGKVTARDSVR